MLVLILWRPHPVNKVMTISFGFSTPQPIFIPLDPGKGDALYFASLTIGTNPNPFRIIADTGSTDFWVYSSTCPTRGNKNSVNASPAPGTRTASFGYENGVTLKAGTIREVVNFGGQFLEMPFAAATEVSASIANRPEEGVMGFARASGSRMDLPPVVDLLALSGLIPEHVTGWKLSRGIDGKNDGELVLGGVNPTKFVAQSTVTVKNLHAIDWQAPVEAASIGNVRVINDPRVAILDTGALYISTSFPDAEALHAFIPGAIVTPAGHYILPCDNQAVLSLSIGGVFWPVDPRDLVDEPVPSGAGLPGYCYSSIQPDHARQPREWLVGSAFLKNVYMILDSTENTIRIAPLR
ncbi:acid protease [Dentipellis sp. KUC8613]|nr:acid protease [Dentipellis sp. KUC8613]